MDIGEVARRAGVPASTLRYYESVGLIESSGRAGLRRQYHPQILDRLALIALGRSAGFSLEEIAGMLRPGVRLALDRGALTAKAEDLDRTIRRLVAMRDGLRHAAVCPAPSHMECPTFRRLMTRALDGGGTGAAGSSSRARHVPRGRPGRSTGERGAARKPK